MKKVLLTLVLAVGTFFNTQAQEPVNTLSLDNYGYEVKQGSNYTGFLGNNIYAEAATLDRVSESTLTRIVNNFGNDGYTYLGTYEITSLHGVVKYSYFYNSSNKKYQVVFAGYTANGKTLITTGWAFNVKALENVGFIHGYLSSTN